jgi:membrane protein
MAKLLALANDIRKAGAELAERFYRGSRAGTRIGQLLSAIDKHDTFRAANAMAFDLFFAIIPLLGLAGYTASLVLRSRPETLVEGSRLLDLAPEEFKPFILRNVTAFADVEVAPVFMLSGLWLSSSAFLTMIRTFEVTFDTAPRSFIKARLWSLGFATLTLVMFVLATAVGAFLTWQSIATDAIQSALNDILPPPLPLPIDIEPLGVLAFVGSSLGIVAFFALLYRFAVVRKGTRRRSFPGAITATMIGLLSSFLLAYYATNLGNYTVFYGSLAIIVVVLLWLWLWCSAILIGAEVNVVLEGASQPTSRAGQGSEVGSAGPTQTPSVIGNPDGD